MRAIVLSCAVAAFASICPTHPQAPTLKDNSPAVEFRDPFTLRLRIDKTHYFEQKFDKIPYVSDGDVYLFVGEDFGVHASISGDEITSVSYCKPGAPADVHFNFRQEDSGGKLMSLLVIQNNLKRRLYMDALMTVPGKKEISKTSILPIPPGLSDFESWPHPIVQLVLRNLRLSATPAPHNNGP